MKVVNINERFDLGLVIFSIKLTPEEYELLDLIATILNMNIRNLIKEAIYLYIGHNVKYLLKEKSAKS